MALRWRWRPLAPSIGLDFPLAMMTKMSDLSPVASSLLIVMDNTATFRLFPASILHIEGLVWLLQRQRVVRRFYDNFLCTIRIFLHPYRFGTIPQLYWHVSAPAMHHTTIKWFRSAVYMLGWQGGVVYSRHNARFSYLVHQKNGVNFHLVWY